MGHVLQPAVSAMGLETERQAEKMYMYSRSSIVQTGPIICAIGMIISRYSTALATIISGCRLVLGYTMNRTTFSSQANYRDWHNLAICETR